jgi:hypothetical protein
MMLICAWKPITRSCSTRSAPFTMLRLNVPSEFIISGAAGPPLLGTTSVSSAVGWVEGWVEGDVVGVAFGANGSPVAGALSSSTVTPFGGVACPAGFAEFGCFAPIA